MPRKPRPLTRGEVLFRDSRLLLIACDDRYAPKQYFDFFSLNRVKVFVIPTEDGTSTPQRALERLLDHRWEQDDERWLICDTDHLVGANHIQNLTSALQRARQCGIFVALSRPCFEVWLLLHHADEAEVQHLSTAAEVEAALRNRLGAYNKTNLQKDHFPLDSVKLACERTQRLDEQTGGGDVPLSTTTRVYKIWASLLKLSLEV